jgi:hypothetical protein
MKKKIAFIGFCLLFLYKPSDAQITIPIIGNIIAKVIQAIDLKIQRLENKTVWLQDVQKKLENTMSELKLGEISDWVQKIRDLYSEYYQELKVVKDVIADYDKVKQIISLQQRIISEFNKAWALFNQDRHFTASELNYMNSVYSGILAESAKNVDQILMVINSFITQMDDAGRMTIVDHAAKSMQQNYNDLKAFNNQNIMLSLQRGVEENDVQSVRQLYNLK